MTEKQTFSSGAHRDTQLGKPDFTRIPLKVWVILARFLGGSFNIDSSGDIPTVDHVDVGIAPQHIDVTMNGDKYHGKDILIFREERLIEVDFIKRIEAVLIEGAAHYGRHNWKKGIPLHRSLASLFRHLFLWCLGDRQEDHLARVATNLMFIMMTEQYIVKGILPRIIKAQPLGTAGHLLHEGKKKKAS